MRDMSTTKKKTTMTMIGKCNRYPAIWAAIYGCEGEGRMSGWNTGTTAGARATREFRCPTCAAVSALTDSLNDRDRQGFLNQAQALADVDSYRYTRAVRTPDGRAAIWGRGPLPSILTRWTDLLPARP